MNVTLINPNLESGYNPNFGLAYVISSVERYFKVKLLDLSFHKKDYAQHILSHLKEFSPRVIGFSATSFTFKYALTIASLIRKFYPRILLVYGGVHPTLLPEETLQNPLVDAVCIGEGEDSLTEYLQRIEQNEEPQGVTGIWYKDKVGTIVKNPLRPFKEDLDSLPFPNWDHWEIEKYLKLNESFIGALRIFASRGCPYSCSFCSNPAIRRAVPGRYYRTRRPEHIIEEIKLNINKYYNKGFKQVVFADENFGLNLEQTKIFCSLYTKEGLSNRIGWSCQRRADLINEEWARIVSGAGCNMVSFGVESGDEHIRMKVYNKEIDDKQIISAINSLHKYNIMCGINIIVICPEDSINSINKSFKLIKKIKPEFVSIGFYNPLPKTTLYNSLKLTIDYVKEGPRRIWNVPRLRSKFLSAGQLEIVVLKIYFFRIYHFFAQGLKMRKMGFLKDIIRYIFGIDNMRTISLFSPHALTDLESRVLFRYMLEDHKRHLAGKTAHAG